MYLGLFFENSNTWLQNCNTMKLESRRLLKIATFTLPMIKLVSLPKICISIVSNTQEKLKTMCLENLAGKNNVYYGLSESEGLFLENLIYSIYYNSNILQHNLVAYFTCYTFQWESPQFICSETTFRLPTMLHWIPKCLLRLFFLVHLPRTSETSCSASKNALILAPKLVSYVDKIPNKVGAWVRESIGPPSSIFSCKFTEGMKIFTSFCDNLSST